ncbi:hypothetical protein V500_10085, partial [Pseudogymnoascus sp. VKM F-4518 (FW-2643)]
PSYVLERMAGGRPKKYANAKEAAAAKQARNREAYLRRQFKKEEGDNKPSDVLQFIPFEPTLQGAPTSVPAPAPAPAPKSQSPQQSDDSKAKKDVKDLGEAMGSLYLQGQLNKEDKAAAAILQELQQDKGSILRHT